MNKQIMVESIAGKILTLRDEKVMLDRDLGDLYGVPTKVLNQAVKRNSQRFPQDFMFQLTKQEKDELVTTCDRFSPLKHSSVPPRAFTEQGVAMLSSVLNSEQAIVVNITIMRAFVQIRQMSLSQSEMARKLIDIEERLEEHDEKILVVFEVIKKLIEDEERPPKKIGYLKERQVLYGEL